MKKNIALIKIIITIIISGLLLSSRNNNEFFKAVFNTRLILIAFLGIVKTSFTRKCKIKLGDILLLVLLMYLIIALYLEFLMPIKLINLLINAGLYTIIFFVAGECVGYLIKSNEE